MLSEFEVVYEHGVLRPAEALSLPENTRLRVTVRQMTIVPTPESQEEGLRRLRAIGDAGGIRMNGKRLTRDEMHERD